MRPEVLFVGEPHWTRHEVLDAFAEKRDSPIVETCDGRFWLDGDPRAYTVRLYSNGDGTFSFAVVEDERE